MIGIKNLIKCSNLTKLPESKLCSNTMNTHNQSTILSICMIVKNEESILRHSLESIKNIADEIIILDTGSTDSTKAIAQDYTDQVYDFEWKDDFGGARNQSVMYAKGEYILRWDADWILRSEGVDIINSLKINHFEGFDLINFRFNVEFEVANDGDYLVESNRKVLEYIPLYFIYKKSKFHWESPIHNRIVLNKEYKEYSTSSHMEVEVDHLKDPINKQHRYKQTRHILEKTLAKRDSQYEYLLPFYIDALMFDNEYESAFKYLTEYIKVYPDSLKRFFVLQKYARCLISLGMNDALHVAISDLCGFYKNNYEYDLLYADVIALTDSTQACELYSQYLLNVENNEYQDFYYTERTLIHPHLMVACLSLQQGDLESASYHLDLVINSTKKQSTLSTAQSLLSSLDIQN